MACQETQTTQGLGWQKHHYGTLLHKFTESLLTGDAKATFNQTVLDIGIHTVEKVQAIKHIAVPTNKSNLEAL